MSALRKPLTHRTLRSAFLTVATTMAAPIVATAGVLLLQVAPREVVDNVLLAPTHTDKEPVTAAGAGRTVTANVAMQPEVGSV